MPVRLWNSQQPPTKQNGEIMTQYRIPSEHVRSRVWPCSVCGDISRERTAMVAKRVIFTTLGAGYDTLRSRTVQYLCPTCRDKDPEWNLPQFSGPSRQERDDAATEE